MKAPMIGRDVGFVVGSATLEGMLKNPFSALAAKLVLLLNDFEQTEILKAIGLSQGFDVHAHAYTDSIPRALVTELCEAKVPTLAIIELDFLNRDEVDVESFVAMMSASQGKSRVLLSASQMLVVRGAQVQWAKDCGAIGLIPSLSAQRISEQVAEHLAPAFAIWNQTANWSRAISFASMVPAGLGRTAELKQAHRLLAEMNAQSASLNDLGQWARESGDIEVKDRRWRLQTYPHCFLGDEAVKALAKRLSCDEERALAVGNLLREAGFFSHVAHEHRLESAELYYRFYEPSEKARRVRLKSLLKNLRGKGNMEGLDIKDRQYLATNFPSCFVGKDCVKLLVAEYSLTVDESVQVMQYLLELGLVRHVTQEHRFKNAELFYEFCGMARVRGSQKVATKKSPDGAVKAKAFVKPATA